MGQRLSGWVAANRQTILNSDPMLDLGEVARALRPPLRSCLSTHLSVASKLVGVLTVYSTHRNAFSEDHRRLVEVVSRQVSQTVLQAVEFQQLNSEKLHDQLTGLPNRQHLERFVASELAGSAGLPCTILLIEMRSTAGTKSSLRNTFEHLFAQSADRIRAALRGADLLFRFDSDKFIALLTQTDALTAEHVARRIIEHVAMGRGSDEDGAAGVVRIGRATAPDDGITLADLVSAAESRAISPPNSRPSVH